MGISELRKMGARPPRGRASIEGTVCEDLVRRGRVARSDALFAQLVARRCDTSLDRILAAEGLVVEEDLLQAHARRLRAKRLDAAQVQDAPVCEVPVDPRLMLKHRFVPLQDATDRPLLASPDLDHLRDITANLPQEIAEAPRVLAPQTAVQNRVATHHATQLAALAQSRVAATESCRNWTGQGGRRLARVLGGVTALCAVTAFYPTAMFGLLVGWAVVTLLAALVLKAAAFVARVSDAGTQTPPGSAAPDVAVTLPRVSILVPLFREREILHALIARLTRLTYPKCLLDVVLLLEEEDDLTQAALAGIDLPPWIRPVLVPDGAPRTKPRAMNYGLDFCEGEIIGILDAEDAPDPDQITVVARRFAERPREVACLQGVLDYYNPRQNWLARCFTIEYAAWFRMILPGMARLGLAIPLGGTTLYFRRDVLEELGGWDAHNVTEDADLGFRLARHGYRTEMLDTVTEEEANCRLWPWIKQRSRWLKGYMVTYLVHMRRPATLYRQLGAWKFWGFQAHFLAAVSQVVLAPVLWSFWLVLLGLPHPLEQVLPHDVLLGAATMFLMLEMMNIGIYAASVATSRHKGLIAWAPTMHLYAPLGAIAAYKALYELVFKPFFWDKTQHGLSLGEVDVPPARASDDAVDLATVELEARHEGL